MQYTLIQYKEQEIIHNFSILNFTALDITQKAEMIVNKRQPAHSEFDLHVIPCDHS